MGVRVSRSMIYDEAPTEMNMSQDLKKLSAVLSFLSREIKKIKTKLYTLFGGLEK